jgi:hypothetical protein
MEKLFEHLCAKNPGRIPYSEAIQLMLWTYCFLDLLPPHLRGIELSRENLTILFAKLSVAGKVEEPSGSDSQNGLKLQFTHKNHWDELVTKFLRGDIELDRSFTDRAKSYV